MFGYKVALVLVSTVLIPAFIALLHFKKFSLENKVIGSLAVYGMLNEAALIAIAFTIGRNLFLTHFYTFFEILLLSIYYILQTTTRMEKAVHIILMISLLMFAIWYTLSGDNLLSANSATEALECVYFCGLSSYLFYKMVVNLKVGNESTYYINGSVLFYFASCFVVFAFRKYKEHDNHDLLIMANVHTIVYVVRNICFARGLWLASRLSYSAA
jgi:hypothetical protein